MSLSLLTRRVSLMVPHGLLPKEYQQLESITSDGNQYLKVNVQTRLTGASIDCKINDFVQPKEGESEHNILFSAFHNQNEGRSYQAAFSFDEHLLFGTHQNTIYTYNEPFENPYGRHILKCDIGYDGAPGANYSRCYIDGNPVCADVGGMAVGQSFVTVFYGTGKDGLSSYSALTLYGFSVEKRDTKEEIVKLIPCRRKADGKVGAYEIYSDTFYTNANTSAETDFVAGDPV